MSLLNPNVGEKLAGLQVLGDVARPGYAFQADPTTGFILDSPGRIGVVASGVLAAVLPDDLTTTEEIQDVVGAMATDSSSVNFTYDDAAGTLTAVVTASGVDHGGLSGLGDDDHTQYLLASGARALSGVWSTGAFSITLGATLLGSAIDLGTSGFRMGTAWLAALNTSGDVTVGDQLLVSGAGPHAIGGAVDARWQFALRGSFSPSGGTGESLHLSATMSPEADTNCFGVGMDFTFVEAGSGTHTDFASFFLNPPTITAGGAALTNASTLKIVGAPTGATNNYALWVSVGQSRFDGSVGLGTVPSFPLHILSSSSDILRIQNTGANSNPNVAIQNDARTYNLQVVGIRADNFEVYDVDAAATRFLITTGGLISIGSLDTLGQLLVDQASTTAAIPVISLEQRDVDQDWFEFDTTIGTGNATEAVGAKTLTTTHFLKVTITGVGNRYIPVGTIA